MDDAFSKRPLEYEWRGPPHVCRPQEPESKRKVVRVTELTLMDPSSETENKLRWVAEVNGAKFQLYIPKARVPEPWPRRIYVAVSDASAIDARNKRLSSAPSDLSLPIVAVVDRVSEHSQTVRFTPRGRPALWEVGEPYIPYSLLPNKSIKSVLIEVRWHQSAGVWERP